MEHRDSSRRQFLRRAVVGTTVAASALGGRAVGADVDSAPKDSLRPRKTKIRIGTRIHRGWLESENDDELRFLKQAGVDYADITFDMIEGYRESGRFTREALKRFVGRLEKVGLQIERANSLGKFYLNAQLNRPGRQEEIDHLKHNGELLAEQKIPIYGIQACQAALHYAGGGKNAFCAGGALFRFLAGL